jgi:hypothetical protein
VIQQGQVFKLQARCVDGDPLWAYRYRIAGRGSARLQVGGFSSKAEAQRALHNKLARLLPGRRAAALTLGEWVEEYLDAHQGERVTVAKLRWPLGKATASLGDVRLVELSPEQVSAWRLTVPEGHRFEATQALRQVLNRAVAWKLIEENPAKHGVPNPRRAAGSSGRSIPGRRSGRSPITSGRCSGRWSCSRPRPGFDPQSCSRSNTATSIVPPVSCRFDGRTRTDGSSRRRRA